MFYSSMNLLMTVLQSAVVLTIIIFLLPLAIPYISNAESFEYISRAMNIEKTMSSYVQNYFPTVIAGKNITRWLVIAAALLLGIALSRTKAFFRDKQCNLKIKKEYEEWKAKVNLPDDAKIITPLEEKIQKLKTANKSEREDLLKVFAETKKRLDAMGRDLAFLSIDIADSAQLKEGEDKAITEYNLSEYRKFVNNKLAANGVLKYAWTTDGMMACLPTLDAAVKAARDVIDGLDAFNKHVSTFKKDFKAKCGINAGYVYYDESVPMEEMSDRVIDVAGHMQKHAAPNTICLAKNIIKPLQEASHFIPISKVIDGYEVYMLNKDNVLRK